MIEESRSLVVGQSNGEQYEVIDSYSNSFNLCDRTCLCRHWQIYGLPYWYACAAIMQSDTNNHHFMDEYHTVASYKAAYTSPIFPIPDDDKPKDDSRPLRLRPPITKKRPGHPRRRRIESQAFNVRELRCSRCHEVGHNRDTQISSSLVCSSEMEAGSSFFGGLLAMPSANIRVAY
ncbi:uncharacterized protein LOC120258664 [Dioscorea cayenensis subsp. rotundata]|uniref:Uncharacterized protein LOC120258664 n=1 Tax=Dioscorea cayennensis subsp. rotundata TaxID=55577 RepID=A0AB40B454_DIOCR|nr:uncharacterized protein LOC120258664 [Dioscorea cayenensis subsp. rotundata]